MNRLDSRRLALEAKPSTLDPARLRHLNRPGLALANEEHQASEPFEIEMGAAF